MLIEFNSHTKLAETYIAFNSLMFQQVARGSIHIIKENGWLFKDKSTSNC